ncbi:septation protein SepH [Microcella alkalica]|uniref:DUF3071 domain-containing protein n=1 Tax=Microcella alkalica TaxID=355930 RepID=A0A839ECE7_9MICO|nr:septation protein SepH [Microcella alkalica]MBA8847005.1 hypothetical protein [Microcella alkalica]
MDELTVIGAENGALIVVSEDGNRYRVPITEALHTALRQNRPAAPVAHRVSPREIQAMIRAGKSAAEVVTETGEPAEYVQRFEGPVVAEREYVVTAARSVPVAVAAETESGVASHTFGGVIDTRLSELSATDVRWSSWKTDLHWIVTVSFLDAGVEREARWTFDPKKATLIPSNHEAQSLSQQGEAPPTLIPRLRAVPIQQAEERTRFDSGAFLLDDDITSIGSPEAPASSSSVSIPSAPPAPAALPHSRMGVRTAGDDGDTADVSQTADLLEALRRRRGEREAAPRDDIEAAKAAHPSTGSIRIVDVSLDFSSDSAPEPEDAPRATAPTIGGANDTGPVKSARRGRAAMPSWDEIVFGARPDDDPA